VAIWPLIGSFLELMSIVALTHPLQTKLLLTLYVPFSVNPCDAGQAEDNPLASNLLNAVQCQGMRFDPALAARRVNPAAAATDAAEAAAAAQNAARTASAAAAKASSSPTKAAAGSGGGKKGGAGSGSNIAKMFGSGAAAKKQTAAAAKKEAAAAKAAADKEAAAAAAVAVVADSSDDSWEEDKGHEVEEEEVEEEEVAVVLGKGVFLSHPQPMLAQLSCSNTLFHSFACAASGLLALVCACLPAHPCMPA
jgi:hypothetical protein